MPEPIAIIVTFDDKGAVAGVKSLSGAIGDVNQQSKAASGSFQSFGQGFLSLEREIGSATIAVAPFVAGIGAVLKAGSDWQTQTAQLNSVLRSTGGIAGITAERAIGLAKSYQDMSRFSDDAILSAENLLLTFTNISGDTFPQATKIVLDMSQALGQDLKQSAIQVGKALQDPEHNITNLRRVGVNFNDTLTEMIKNMAATGDIAGADAAILKELNTEFGGSAAASAETFAGKIDRVKNSLHSLLEEVGGRAIGGFEGIFGNLDTMFKHFRGEDLPPVAKAMYDAKQRALADQSSTMQYDPNGMPVYTGTQGPSGMQWLDQTQAGALAARQVFMSQFEYEPRTGGLTQERLHPSVTSLPAGDEWGPTSSTEAGHMRQQARIFFDGLKDAAQGYADTATHAKDVVMQNQRLIDFGKQLGNVWNGEIVPGVRGTLGPLQQQVELNVKNAQTAEKHAQAIEKARSQTVVQLLGGKDNRLADDIGSGMQAAFEQREKGRSKSQQASDMAEFKKSLDDYAVATGQITREGIKARDMQESLNKSFAAGKIGSKQYVDALLQMNHALESGKTSMDQLNHMQLQFMANQTKKPGEKARLSFESRFDDDPTGKAGTSNDPYAPVTISANKATQASAAIGPAAIQSGLQSIVGGLSIAAGMAPGQVAISKAQGAASVLLGTLKQIAKDWKFTVSGSSGGGGPAVNAGGGFRPN